MTALSRVGGVATSALSLSLALIATAPMRASAQQSRLPLTRAGAIEAALTHGVRLPAAAADTLVAAGQLVSARAFANPTLVANYSKSTPQYHAQLELPLPFPWVRGARIGSARFGATVAHLRYTLARAAAALDADTSYTLALAAVEHTRLTAETAAAADTLLRMAVARRDAGDASDLDVELARVNAGQQANSAASDSLALQTALLELQLAIGLTADSVYAFPTDSLRAPAVEDSTAGETLGVAAAAAQLRAATLGLSAERRAAWAAPSLLAGIETHDPSGSEPGILPIIGLSLPLPLFDRNRGAVAIASAERQRAIAELALARLEGRTRIAQLRRERTSALARIARSEGVVASANRVAAMSLVAYREGAATLPNVLEAQRNARAIIAQYIDDLARAWIATATLRALTLTATR